jgi:hypothetical protein
MSIGKFAAPTKEKRKRVRTLADPHSDFTPSIGDSTSEFLVMLEDRVIAEDIGIFLSADLALRQ